eukprot:747695-Hanusia_phi.AAC.1
MLVLRQDRYADGQRNPGQLRSHRKVSKGRRRSCQRRELEGQGQRGREEEELTKWGAGDLLVCVRRAVRFLKEGARAGEGGKHEGPD